MPERPQVHPAIGVIHRPLEHLWCCSDHSYSRPCAARCEYDSKYSRLVMTRVVDECVWWGLVVSIVFSLSRCLFVLFSFGVTARRQRVVNNDSDCDLPLHSE